MGFRPQGLLGGAERLAAIVAKIPKDVVEEMDDETWSRDRWPAELVERLVDPTKAGMTSGEWEVLRARVRRQDKQGLGLLEEHVAGIASNPSGCMITCPCALVARWESGRIVMLQRYASDWDHEDRELGSFDEAPTFGEVVGLVGLVLNDPDWLDGEIKPTWQQSLAIQEVKQDYGWEVSVGSERYPRLEEWFENEWRGVLAAVSEQEDGTDATEEDEDDETDAADE